MTSDPAMVSWNTPAVGVPDRKEFFRRPVTFGGQRANLPMSVSSRDDRRGELTP
jgi:hypothetical protein